MRRLTAPALIALLGAAVFSASCSPVPNVALPEEAVKSSVKKVTKDPPVFPVPKSPADAEKIGIPIYPGSTLDDQVDSATLDERASRRTYKVKVYAPTDYVTVVGFYMQSIKNARKSGADDTVRIDGQSASGDEIEVMLSPVGDKKKTLVMAWLTQEK